MNPNDCLCCFVPAGYVNRQLFAYMFALTTLSGDNMSVLLLQLKLLPTNRLNYCCFRNNSHAIIPNINRAVKGEAADHLTSLVWGQGTGWSPWASSGLEVEVREVYSCHDLECLLTILSSPLKRWKIFLFHTSLSKESRWRHWARAKSSAHGF